MYLLWVWTYQNISYEFVLTLSSDNFCLKAFCILCMFKYVSILQWSGKTNNFRWWWNYFLNLLLSVKSISLMMVRYWEELKVYWLNYICGNGFWNGLFIHNFRVKLLLWLVEHMEDINVNVLNLLIYIF